MHRDNLCEAFRHVAQHPPDAGHRAREPREILTSLRQSSSAKMEAGQGNSFLKAQKAKDSTREQKTIQ